MNTISSKTDHFSPIPLNHLLKMVLRGMEKGEIFGVPADLTSIQSFSASMHISWLGKTLATPLGTAAGPHTQMAQNIIISWLCGARYIELKTVQTLDKLEISKPCIDIRDEGYNCEWSQELSLEESFDEYLKAWIVIHILDHKLKMDEAGKTIFNMSLGYNLEGILQDNMQLFISNMLDANEKIKFHTAEIKNIYPAVSEIEIPSCISNNVTLSTMHGCPPDEIEKIGKYLIGKKLHTIIKLNPTLLGKEMVHGILNHQLGFKTQVPDEAFEHDLKWEDAIGIVSRLKSFAGENKVYFGVKLSNTLESNNIEKVFDPSNEKMYMSGRALHPLTVNLANKLQQEFNGELNLSFCGGADCFNIVDLVKAGLAPVTVCTDLLKPGGYGRLKQYFTNLETELKNYKAKNLDELSLLTGHSKQTKEAQKNNLAKYAKNVAESSRYHREPGLTPEIKTSRALEFFDCIAAPCMSQCAANQNIPGYLNDISNNQLHEAAFKVLQTNPFPSVTGNICDHLCQLKCTRMNIDESLKIREMKRYISEEAQFPRPKEVQKKNAKTAIIGAGPAGLSCAYYLALAGMQVDVFEQTNRPGGMISWAIPPYRLRVEDIMKDVKRVEDAGVKIHYNSPVDESRYSKLLSDYSSVFIASGAAKPVKLEIEGIDSEGVFEPLEILFEVNQGKRPVLGKNIAVIGGGNTAADAARTALRLAGKDAKVSIVYRRTINEMPADKEEIKAAIREGIEILELLAPEKITSENGRVTGLQCSRMQLGSVDASGRQKPEKIIGSEHVLPFDTIVPAIGQERHASFTNLERLISKEGSLNTQNPAVWIGGDALRGPATAIKAIGDGRKVAEEILKQFNLAPTVCGESPAILNVNKFQIKQATRQFSEIEETIHPMGFEARPKAIEKEEAMKESSRCLQCDQFCNICVSICPNRAMYGYTIKPIRYSLQKAVKTEIGIQFEEDQVFEIKQKYQVLNIADFCNECGNCTSFCPTSGKPFNDKPKFCLSLKSLKEYNEVFYLSKLKDRNVLIYKERTGVKTLTKIEEKQEFHYETDHVIAVFDVATFRLKEVKFRTPCVKQSQFAFAAEMSVLYEAAIDIIF